LTTAYGYVEDANSNTLKYDPMGVYRVQKEGWFDPNVATYPIVMNDTHQKYRFFSAADSNPEQHDLARHTVWINVPLAKQLNVVDGDLIRVYNGRGTMIVPAYVTSRMMPGEAYMFEGAWFQPDLQGIDRRGSANLLANDGRSPAQMCHNYLVTIEKV